MSDDLVIDDETRCFVERNSGAFEMNAGNKGNGRKQASEEI